jgi:Domain of unknown function (DUF397)
MITAWRKSSRSGGATDEMCVEVGVLVGGVAVRDSKNPASGHLRLERAEFGALVHAIKRGTFDRAVPD